MKDNWKMVVLDDDPTGIQTVHGCLLVTEWDDAALRRAFGSRVPFFYVLTNTRAMTRTDAERTVREAMEAVVRVNREFGCELIVVSRSDSCLRGHFPLETDVMREVLIRNGIRPADKTVFCPAFIEAGRVTIDGVHYMKDGGRLIPVSETEFARDNVFAYHTSVLRDYIREKGADPDDYQIVDAQSYDELRHFAATLTAPVVIRSSSSLPKAIAGLDDKPLLDRSILRHTDMPGCFVVGSHVQKTTRQLQHLLSAGGTGGVEVDVQCILDDPQALMQQTLAIILDMAQHGVTPVVYTSRREIRVDDADLRQQLGQRVSDFLVDVVRQLPYVPSYLVAKGGITSHDILTKGLGVKSAEVLGQIVPSVPCIMTERFPYIIFPGNVGGEESLREVYMKFKIQNSKFKIQN